MIDWSQPVCTMRTKRRLFVTWRGRDHVMLDTMEGRVGTGFRYHYDGSPVDGCPYGDVEQVELDDVFLPMETVERHEAVAEAFRENRRREFAEQVVEQNAANPLWGMF